MGYFMYIIVTTEKGEIASGIDITASFYNRWLHVCHAIDFNALKMTTVVNGINSTAAFYDKRKDISFTGGIGEKPLKNNLVIGVVGNQWWGGWAGKIYNHNFYSYLSKLQNLEELLGMSTFFLDCYPLRKCRV